MCNEGCGEKGVWKNQDEVQTKQVRDLAMLTDMKVRI